MKAKQGLTPVVNQRHEILSTISENIPPITGYVLTTLKQNPLVEAPLLAPMPGAPNNTVLGRVDVWLWVARWRSPPTVVSAGPVSGTDWEDRDKLFVQMVRWSMRPLLDHGNFVVNSQVRDGELEVNVQALTPEGDFVNNLTMTGGVTGALRTTSRAICCLNKQGRENIALVCRSKRVALICSVFSQDAGMGVLRTGINVPPSAEYRDTTTNESLLAALAQLKPVGRESRAS